MKADRVHLPELVSQIVFAKELPSTLSHDAYAPPTPVVKIGGRLLLCTISEVSNARDKDGTEEMAYLILAPATEQTSLPPATKSALYIPVTPGKKGQTEFLQAILPQSIQFIRKYLADGRSICVACESGKELSVGVVLAAIQLFFTDEGKLIPFGPESDDIHQNTSTNGKLYVSLSFDAYTQSPQAIDKHSIRTRLEWIIASRPQANPSRTTLKRVNEFLLTPPSLRNPKSS